MAQSPLKGVRDLLSSAGWDLATLGRLRGSTAGSALLALANSIDQLGGWDVVARSGGDLAKTARKTWQLVTTGELVDPKRPIPTTADVRALLGGGALPGGGADRFISGASAPLPVASPSGVGFTSYWTRMGTSYNPARYF